MVGDIPPRDNIVLIGMPGVGKSTLGVLLAKRTSRSFVDTDVSLQVHHGKPLQLLLEEAGVGGFRKLEEAELMALACRNTVVATGGSAVYSAAAMTHLAASGIVVFLSLPLDELETRLSNFGDRGVVRQPGQSLADLFAERMPLYRRHAEVTVDCSGLGHEAAVERIISASRAFSPSARR